MPFPKIDNIIVRMSDDDFVMLCENSQRWAGHGWSDRHPNRFVSIHGGEMAVHWNFAHAYWFDRWADVLIGRAFLEARHQEYQVLIDDGVSQFVVVTDFATPQREDD
jgi:hypothetical protein